MMFSPRRIARVSVGRPASRQPQLSENSRTPGSLVRVRVRVGVRVRVRVNAG